MARKRDIVAVNGFSEKKFLKSKKVKQYSSEDAHLANIFESLASEEKNDRLTAAQELVKYQHDHSADATQCEKVLKRLVRGLCSNRKAARAGFFIALTASLQEKLWTGDKSTVRRQDALILVDLIEKQTLPDGGSQEKRDHMIGKVYAYHAVIQSGVLFDTEDSGLHEVLHAFGKASMSTPWSREQYGSICCDAIRNLAKTSSSIVFAQVFMDAASQKDVLKTPEGVAIWIVISKNFPTLKFPRHVWTNQSPLDLKEEKVLTKILLSQQTLSQDGDEQADNFQNGSRQNAPHFVWDILLDHYLSCSDSDNPGLVRFWEKMVDKSYFAQHASPERKSLGFQLISKVIALDTSQTVIDCVLSPNVVRCLINQSSQPERYLHAAARAVLNLIVARAKAKSDLLPFYAINMLMFRNGDPDFDRLSNSKTIHNLLVTGTPSTLQLIIRNFQTFIIEPTKLKSSAEPAVQAETTRQLIADHILALIRTRVGAKSITDLDMQWVSSALIMLANVAYLNSESIQKNTRQVPVPELSINSREMLQVKLSSCLTHILSTQPDKASELLRNLSAIIQSGGPNAIVTLQKADENIKKLVAEAHSWTESLEKADINDELVNALSLLLSMSLLLAYGGDLDAISMLEDLRRCVQPLLARKIYQMPKTAKQRTATVHETSSEDNYEGIDVIFETVFSLASRPSGLCRKTIERAFPGMASLMTLASLQSMLTVLAQKENASGQRELFEEAVEASSTSDAESDHNSSSNSNDDCHHDSDADDVMVFEAQKNEKPFDRAGLSSDEDSEEDQEVDEELNKFNTLLAETLGTANKSENDKDEMSEHDSADDTSMDDEEMLALDPKLTEIFRERAAKSNKDGPKNKKREQKDAKQNVLNFKNRMLDLLQIFIRYQHKNPLLFHLFTPLLRLIRETSTKQIAEKTASLLKTLCDTAKHKGMPEKGSHHFVFEQLKEVHEEALQQDASKMHGVTASRCSLFLVRCYINNENDWTDVSRLYEDTLRKVREGRGRMPVSFFGDWVEWSMKKVDTRGSKSTPTSLEKQKG